MREYEVFHITKAHDLAYPASNFPIMVPTANDAMKVFLRETGRVFYHSSWYELLMAYKEKDDTAYVVVPKSVFASRKRTILFDAHNALFKDNKTHKCDCGSEKVYGKSDAHAFYCSIRKR